MEVLSAMALRRVLTVDVIEELHRYVRLSGFVPEGRYWEHLRLRSYLGIVYSTEVQNNEQSPPEMATDKGRGAPE